MHTEVTSRDWTHVTSDDHHIPSQLWNSTTSLSTNDMFGYCWCHKQWSLSTIIVPVYIYFNIPGCYYFYSIFAHRPEVHRSADNSAVGLVALRCEQCSSFIDSSSVLNDSWCFHRLMLVKHYPSSTYIPDPYSSFCCSLCTAPCSDCVFVRIAPLQCSQICNDFAKHFDFRSTA